MAGGYLQIGQVAEQTELSVKTIRHYDEIGLVTPSARSGGGFRLYTADDVDRLLVVRRMKPLGFALEQMRQLLEALDTLADGTATADRRRAARADLDEIREQARERGITLRRQLGYAEEFVELLAARGR